MKVNYDSLKKIVDSAKLEYYEEFSYGGLNYLFFPCEFDDEDIKKHESPAFSKPSDIIDWDIYMGANLIEEAFRKPVLLHEILEVAVCQSLFCSGLSDKERFKRGHKIAREFDDKYACRYP